MRLKRKLAENVWYEVRTKVNVGEPLFRLPWAVSLFCRVFIEAIGRFDFEIRGFCLDGESLSFFIKPADGFKLPKIMQWMKQTFSARFNVRTGKTGHVWGERYWSKILPGEPPAEAGEVDWAKVVKAVKGEIPEAAIYTLSWVSPRPAGRGTKSSFSPEFRFSSEPPH
jgi:REP element-mobilizing transposase RayT